MGSLAVGGAAAMAAFDASCFGETAPTERALETTLGDSANEGKAVPTLTLESLYDTSLSATSLTGEAADRVAIRRLIDAWAHFADRRLAEQQAALFTLDGTVENYQSMPQGAHPAR